jgi:L-amino acid N-acyltransferase YncA
MTPTNIRVRSALATDAEVIAGIYNHYIQNTVITFEEERVSA